MKYTDIAGLDIKISRLGLGCLQLGGHGWGKVSEPEMVKAVHSAIDSGITFFDSAPIYGLGHSEEMLGRILGPKRKTVVITTKAGLVWEKDETFQKFTDSSPANIEREIDASLKRLKTDYIDVYQIHWPDPDTPIQDTLPAIEKLKKAGKIRAIGLCNFSLTQLKEALKCCRIASMQLPYNLIDRKIEQDLLPFCRENSVAVIAYSPIARGLLGGKYDMTTKFATDDHRARNEDEYFGNENLSRNLKSVDRIRLIARKLGKTPAQVALRWVMENPDITTAIFGAKTVAQLEENVEAMDFALSPEDMEFLKRET